MRILFFSQYFVPEVTAPRVRAEAFAEGLARLGHEVEVICEVPNHPTGIIYPGYGEAGSDRGADRRLRGDLRARVRAPGEDDPQPARCSTGPTQRPRRPPAPSRVGPT